SCSSPGSRPGPPRSRSNPPPGGRSPAPPERRGPLGPPMRSRRPRLAPLSSFPLGAGQGRLAPTRQSPKVSPDLLAHQIPEVVRAGAGGLVRIPPVGGRVHARGESVQRGVAPELEEPHLGPIAARSAGHDRGGVGPDLLEDARLARVLVDRFRHGADILRVLRGLTRAGPPVIDQVDRLTLLLPGPGGLDRPGTLGKLHATRD